MRQKRSGDHIKASIAICALLIWFSAGIRAQQSNILYYMRGVPQSHLLNPATQPRCGFYLGLPGVSPFQVNAENSAFGLNDVMWYNGDSTITFMHPDGDKDKFLDLFGKANYVSADVSTSIISYGFRSGNMYYTFDITQKVFSRFSYPGDLIRLALKGNEEDDEFDLSSLGVTAMTYTEFSTGVSHALNDMITIGYKGKILLGGANITTKKSDILLTTSTENWTVDSKYDLNVSIPGLTIGRDSAGNFDPDEMTISEDLQASDYISAITGNFGLGLDLGIHVRPVENLTLSASILDLGYIRWKSNTYNLVQDTRFVFDPEVTFEQSDTGVVVKFWGETDFGEAILDSIENSFVNNNSETETAYTTYLPAKLYLGVKYDIIDQISVSVLSRSELYKGRIRQQLSFSANFYPIHMLSATLNYTIMNRTFNNFGAGLALKAGPFNWYIISDNIPLVYAREINENIILPHKARAVNFRIGFNLLFACQRDKRKYGDLPLFF
ncbi:MAG: hypothetical protein JW723_09545 [Bacteroidales bacterium]|nr:hypothetical protein [Bacteroidales bacterium]